MAEGQGKPLTREEVLKMIEEHGGSEGLDLSGRNLEGIDLSSLDDESALDLHGIILKDAKLQGAKLRHANLQQAFLWSANLQEADLTSVNLQEAELTGANLQEAFLGGANLQRARLVSANLQRASLWSANLQKARLKSANLQEADLTSANLQRANLTSANLQRANLTSANLQEADFGGAKLAQAKLDGTEISKDTKLGGVYWGDYVLAEEFEKSYDNAAAVYRVLRLWHTQAGMYDIAGRFYYREAEAIRKGLRWKEKPWPKLWNWIFWVLCGYTERPERVVLWAAVVVFGLALGIYTASALTFPSSLYYSAVSFTALGYGLGVSTPDSWVKGLGAIEAFIGVSLIALFLVTFVRKMTR